MSPTATRVGMRTRRIYRSFRRPTPGIPRRYRDSYRRLRAIHLGNNWSREFWIVVVATLIVGVLVATGVIEHPPH
jgi:hypothetical protein